MKTLCSKAQIRAFTLVELLVLIILIALLWAMLLPADRGRKMKAILASCQYNQKQIAVGIYTWANEHQMAFPWRISETNGGSMEVSTIGDAAGTFRTLSTYDKNLRVFHCPSDRTRWEATNINELDNTNISYFIAFDSGKSPAESILLGDRNLEANGNAVSPGLFVYSTNNTMLWARGLHSISKTSRGSATFYDGHVELLPESKLNAAFVRESLPTNHLAVP